MKLMNISCSVKPKKLQIHCAEQISGSLGAYLDVLRVTAVWFVLGQQDISRHGEASVWEEDFHVLPQLLEPLFEKKLQLSAALPSFGLEQRRFAVRLAFTELPHTQLLYDWQNVVQAVLEGAVDP